MLFVFSYIVENGGFRNADAALAGLGEEQAPLNPLDSSSLRGRRHDDQSLPACPAGNPLNLVNSFIGEIDREDTHLVF